MIFVLGIGDADDGVAAVKPADNAVENAAVEKQEVQGYQVNDGSCYVQSCSDVVSV